MTLQELKEAVLKKWPTIKQCAQDLGVSYNTLQAALNGQNPLTKALKNHIMLALGKRECILVYKVEVTEQKVHELTDGKGCACDADRIEALKQIIAFNFDRLVELGASLNWTPEQREAWGLPPAEMPAPSEMPTLYIPAAHGPHGPTC